MCHLDTRTPVTQALAESGPLLPATHASGPPRLYFSPVFISPDVLLGRKVRHADAACALPRVISRARSCAHHHHTHRRMRHVCAHTARRPPLSPTRRRSRSAASSRTTSSTPHPPDRTTRGDPRPPTHPTRPACARTCALAAQPHGVAKRPRTRSVCCYMYPRLPLARSWSFVVRTLRASCDGKDREDRGATGTAHWWWCPLPLRSANLISKRETDSLRLQIAMIV